MSDCDFEFESDGGEEAEEFDDLAIQIENTFYEAEDQITGNPDLAVVQFLKVIELDEQRTECQTGAAVHWTFKSLLNIIVTCARLERYKDVLIYYERLLNLLDKVTRNEASEAINHVLNALSGRRKINDENEDEALEQGHQVSEELKYLERVYEMTLETLKRGGYMKLWFETSIRLANLYIQQNNVTALKKSVKELYAVCAPSDDPTAVAVTPPVAASPVISGSPSVRFDASKQSASLFELYTLDTQLCLMTKDSERMRRVYPKTLQMSVSVTDPRTVANLRHSGGLMYMDDKKWGAAYSEFFEAFKNYQEIGSAAHAKRALKFVVVANLLSLSEINPFHSREASVYQDDPEIAAVRQLRLAFDSKDTQKIGQILTDPTNPLLHDSTIMPYLADLLRNVRLQLVQQAIVPYTSIKLSQIAQTLSISEAELMPLIVKLILDKSVDAEINGEKGILKVRSRSQFGLKSESETQQNEDQPMKDNSSAIAAATLPICFSNHNSGLNPVVESLFTEYASVLNALTELTRRVEGIEGSGASLSLGESPRYLLRSSSKQDGGCSSNLYQHHHRLGKATMQK